MKDDFEGLERDSGMGCIGRVKAGRFDECEDEEAGRSRKGRSGDCEAAVEG